MDAGTLAPRPSFRSLHEVYNDHLLPRRGLISLEDIASDGTHATVIMLPAALQITDAIAKDALGEKLSTTGILALEVREVRAQSTAALQQLLYGACHVL